MRTLYGARSHCIRPPPSGFHCWSHYGRRSGHSAIGQLSTCSRCSCWWRHSAKCENCLLQEGLLALWRGWLPSVIGVIPYVGLNFAVYETSKDLILKHYGAGSTGSCNLTIC